MATEQEIIAKQRDGGASITCLAAYDDYICLGQSDGIVAIYGDSYEPIKVFTDATDPISHIFMDSEYIYASSTAGKVYIWSVLDEKLETIIDVYHEDGVVVFSDPDYFYTGGADGRIIIWNKRFWDQKHEIKAHDGAIRSISSDEVFIYSSGSEGTVKSWKKESWEESTIIKGLALPLVENDDENLYIASDIEIYLFKKGKYTNPLKVLKEDEAIKEIRVDDKLIYVLYQNGHFKVILKETLNKIFFDSRAIGNPLSLVPTTQFIYAAHANGSISRWEKKYLLPIIERKEESPILFNRVDNKYLYMVLKNGEIVVKDKHTLDEITKLYHGNKPVKMICVDGQYIYASLEKNRIGIWEKESWEFIAELSDFTWSAFVIAVENGYLYAASGYDLFIYEKGTWNQIATYMEDSGIITSLIVDTEYIYIGTHKGTISVVDKRSLEQRKLIKAHKSGVRRLIIKHGLLYSAGADGAIKSWDLNTFELRKSSHISRIPIRSMTADDEILYAAVAGDIRAYDKDLNLKFMYINQWSSSIATDEKYLYSGNMGGIIHIWEKPLLYKDVQKRIN